MQSAGLVLVSYQDVVQRAMAVIANNVANVNSTGYKRFDMQFSTQGKETSRGQKLNFVVDKATIRDTTPGRLTTTGSPLDIAISGSGYFNVQSASGQIKYTRAGSFQLNEQGQIVTATGEKLLSTSDQPIIINSDIENIQISGDGLVTGKIAGPGTEITQLGKIKLVNFDDEQAMKLQGAGLYTVDGQVPKLVTNPQLVQGMVESSNVDPIREMTKMIDILRTYQNTANLLDKESQRQKDSIARLSRATV